MTSFLASHQSFSLCWFMFVLVEPPSSVLIWKHKFDPLGVSSSLTIPASWSCPPNYHLAMSRCSIVSGQEWPVWLQVQFQGANSIFLCGTKDKVRVVRMLPCVCFTWKCAWQGARLVKVTIQVHTALWWWVAPGSLCCRSANVLQSWCSDRWKCCTRTGASIYKLLSVSFGKGACFPGQTVFTKTRVWRATLRT